MVKKIISKQGKASLEHQGYIYTFDRMCNNYNSWRCRYRTCPGRLQTSLITEEILKTIPHTHNNLTDTINASLIFEKMKELCITNKLEFYDCLREAESCLSITFPKTRKVVTIQTQYSKFLKSIEYPVSDANEILDIYRYTYSNNLFLQHDSGSNDSNRIIIFTTAVFKNYLEKCTVILSDGTFRSTPKGYAQVYIIYGFFFGQTTPLAWCLMRNRKKESYVKLLTYLKTYICSCPQHWILDFEVAPVSAISDTYPTTELHGCWFHFTQICVRWVINNDLLNRYQSDGDFMSFVKKIMILAYFPEADIVSTFKEIEHLADDSGKLEFYKFFNRNFIICSDNILTKSLSFWSCHKRIENGIPITTNSCEAYHRHLNTKVRKTADTFERFVNVLKKEEDRLQKKYNNLMNGINISNRKDDCERRFIIQNYKFYNKWEFIIALMRFCTPPLSLNQ